MEPRLRVLEPSPAVLRAHLELERLRALRHWLVQLLALLGVPLWFTAAWPRLVPGAVHALLLAAWAVVGAASTWAVVAVVLRKRRYDRLDAGL